MFMHLTTLLQPAALVYPLILCFGKTIKRNMRSEGLLGFYTGFALLVRTLYLSNIAQTGYIYFPFLTLLELSHSLCLLATGYRLV